MGAGHVLLTLSFVGWTSDLADLFLESWQVTTILLAYVVEASILFEGLDRQARWPMLLDT